MNSIIPKVVICRHVFDSVRLACFILAAGLGISTPAAGQVLPPTITKSFTPPTMALSGINAATTLSFTLTNPNQTTTLNNVSFTDTLPAGLILQLPPNLVGTCGNGTITANAHSDTISLSGATAVPGASCTFSVLVNATTAGVKINSVTATSTESGSSAPATASVTVLAAPVISKQFGAASIPMNQSTSLTFTISNPNPNNAITGITFTDPLPNGVVVAAPNNLTGTCGGGTITAVPGNGLVILAGATLAPSAQCVFSVNVTGMSSGVKQNQTGPVSSSNTGAGESASASMTVLAPLSMAKQFGASSIPLNGTTSLTFIVSNPNATVAMTGVQFNDILPAGLMVATPNNLTGNCGGGTITAVAGSSSVSLTGATLAAGTQCTFLVNVTGATAGTKTNNVTVSSINGGEGNASTASITVVSPPTITKQFGAATVSAGDLTTLTFTLTNLNTTTALTGVGFTDLLPAGLRIGPGGPFASVPATARGLAGACNLGSLMTEANSVTLSGVTLTPGGTCLVLVNVVATGAGPQHNVTSPVTSVEGGMGAAASASIVILTPPAANIPTLSEWPLMALSVLLAVGGLIRLRSSGRGA